MKDWVGWHLLKSLDESSPKRSFERAPSPRESGGRDRASLMTLGITFRKRRTEKGPAATSRRHAWRRGAGSMTIRGRDVADRDDSLEG